MEPTINVVKALLILDSTSNERVMCKYYSPIFPTEKEQRRFEKEIVNNYELAGPEIMIQDEYFVVFKPSNDLLFAIVSDINENSMFLYDAMETFFGGILEILKNDVRKETLMNGITNVVLLLDSFIFNGIILEFSNRSLIENVFLEESPMEFNLNRLKEEFKYFIMK